MPPAAEDGVDDAEGGTGLRRNDGVELPAAECEIETVVEIGGTVASRQGLNIPGSTRGLAAVPEEDLDMLRFGESIGVDVVALSFVRSADDVESVRRHTRLPLVAKIEKPQAVDNAAKVMRGGAQTLLLLTGSALTEQGLALAAQIAGKTGCKVMGQTYNPRMARGRGRFSIDRIPYVIEQALPILKDFRHIVLVEANDPVAFFAYPNKPSMLKPDGCEVHRLTSGGENSVAALEALAAALGARPIDAKPQALVELAKPTGALTHASIAQAIAMAIPENAIVVDESVTTGRGFFPPTAAAPPHDWLQNMGGSIGFSTPVATGAAVACPDRKVICMVGDGSAMYTLQSLWTQAREGLNVLTIVFANRIYQILRGEFDGVGAGEPGQRALDMLKIDRPALDFVALAKGMGVPGRAVTSVDDFVKALADAVAEPGPRLIEVQM